MMSIKTFIKNFTKEIHEQNAAIFAGAGLSVSSGFVTWKELLREIAEEMHLDIDKEHDLIGIAQYHLNSNRNRYELNQRIIDKFSSISSLNSSHEILSSLPIQTYWTTNYDTLIETALRQKNKKVDVKLDQRSLATNVPNRDAVVYKMHGDITLAADAVVTKDDYETYNEKRQLFTTALQGDLVSKTFLFIGFSFEDPNLSWILSRIRTLLGENSRKHYAFFKECNIEDYRCEADFIYAQTKQGLLFDDLKRYAIDAVLVNDYDAIPNILNELKRRINLRNVFISGSADQYGKWNKEQAVNFFSELVTLLIDLDLKIITGFGLGVGSFIINKAVQEITQKKYSHFNDYLEINPFPFQLEKEEKKIFNATYRDVILSHTGIAIFLFGNKEINGEVVEAEGVLNEFKLARDKGLFVIPIGSTGYAASRICSIIEDEIEEHSYLQDELPLLKKSVDVAELLESIKRVIKKIIGG